jgi:hypothetical protein
MNKKVWIGALLVFIVLEILMFLINGVILSSAYSAIASVFRHDMSSKMWMYHVINVVTAFFFTFIFSKGYEKKGIMEGIRYGFYIGVWMSVSMALGTDAMITLGRWMTIQWLIYGVIEYMIAGVVLALVFKEKPQAAA